MSKRLVHGVGVNDSKESVYMLVNGKWDRCPYYRKWAAMLERCYSPKSHKKHPTYIDCSVCDEWLYFSNFKVWMEAQDWEGMELDKDLIIDGNRVYSPDACCFIDRATNGLLKESAASNGDCPTGVYFRKDTRVYVARCCDENYQKHLGIFKTQEPAHKAYLKYKSGVILRAAEKQTDNRVKGALIARADALLIQSREINPSPPEDIS